MMIQQKLLCGDDYSNLNSVTLLYYSSPFNVTFYLVMSVFTEGLLPWLQISDFSGAPVVIIIIIF